MTTSQPSPSSALMVSGGSSRGAKIRTFGFDMDAPGGACAVAGGGGKSAGSSIQLNSALLERPFPAHGFLAEKGVELFRRARYRVDASLVELLGSGGIGVDTHDLGVELVDEHAWSA